MNRRAWMAWMAWMAWAAAALAAAGASGEDWPQFLGPRRNGTSAETNLLSRFSPSGAKVLWRVDVEWGYGGAAVHGGEVFFMDSTAAGRDTLRCVRLGDGSPQWQYAYDAPGKVTPPGSRSTPAVSDRHVFIVGPTGEFHCLDRRTHKPLWRKNLAEDYGRKPPGWGVTQSPLLLGDVVIAAPQHGRAGLIAYEPATGKERWRSSEIGSLAFSSPIPAVIGGVEQVVMLTNGATCGVRASDGKVLWRYTGWRTLGAIAAPTIIGSDRVFITGGYNMGSVLLSLRQSGGEFAAKEDFRLTIGSQIHGAILIGDHLYMVANENKAKNGLACVDLSGTLKWQTGTSPGLDRGNFIYADGRIYSMDGGSGELRIIEPSPAGYKELAKAKVLDRRPCWAAMALSDGKLICRDRLGLKCVDLRRPP